MGILEQLLARIRSRKPARCAIVVGDGQFNCDVASTAQQRFKLERLCSGRTQDPYRFPALLIPQPNNARGPDTVAVRIGDATVGYLHHTTAMEFLAALRAGEYRRAACGAIIVRRADPQHGDQAFCIRLDAGVPFKLADPASQKVSDGSAGGALDGKSTPITLTAVHACTATGSLFSSSGSSSIGGIVRSRPVASVILRR
jgi:hypothetical protein